MLRGLVRLVLMLVVALPVFSQQALLFDHITAADGLPGNEVCSVFEDRHGYMWAGTITGLARLEGTRVRAFHHDRNDSTTIAHDQVNHMMEDAQGRLWLATMAGLSRYDEARGSFRSYRVKASGSAAHQANRMQQVQCIGDSLLWVVSEQGLYRFDIRTGRFRAGDKQVVGNGPAGQVNDRSALRWDAARQGMWVASSEGLAFWDAGSDRWTDHRNAPASQPWFGSTPVSAIALHGTDTLWYFDDREYAVRGVRLGTGESFRGDPEEGGLGHFTMRWQDTDPDGRLWISTWTHRLFHRDLQGHWLEVVPSDKEPAALRSSRVFSTVRTRNGERWFGSGAGIAILRPASSAMRVLALPGNEVEVGELYTWGPDTLLAGTYGQGIHLIDLRTGKITVVRNERVPEDTALVYFANRVEHFARREEGGLWVCTTDMPATFDPRTLSFAPAPLLGGIFPPGRRAHYTFIEPGDTNDVWVGTWRHGLYHIDTRSGAHTRSDTADGPFGRLPSRMMLCWLRDSQGRRWLGMNDGGGVACLEGGRFRIYEDTDGGNAGGVVRCIAEAPDGLIWLGTHEEGIVILDPEQGTTRYLNRRNGLPGVRVGKILFDRNGNAWATTDQGLARRAPGAEGFQRMALPDGLEHDAITGALAELVDGRIAFGVGTRIVIHDPAKDKEPQHAPMATFTTYRINDDRYASEPSSKDLRLASDRKALTLELGAVGLAPRTTPLFRYRLLSRGAAWTDIGAAQRIDLFDLPPGEHRIEVQASENGVDWSSEPARLRVEVLPPFWAAWWFRASIAVVLLGGLYVGVRAYVGGRLRRERERHARETAVLDERMRIAGDMHDDMGAGLSALKLRSEMALRVEKDPGKREQLSALSNTAGELIGSMRQIIWTMNGDQASVEDLVVYTTNYARTYCEHSGLIPEIVRTEQWPDVRLQAEQRRNIFLVVKEALHNVVKHANAGRVRVEMTWNEGLSVDVQDDGIGLPAHAHDSVGNGLRNMRKRIATLGGTLEAEAGPGMPGDLPGTRIRFHVPMKNAGANQRSIAAGARPPDIRTA